MVMQQELERRLDAIHNMLDTGHRSIRLEPHTLPLWGITLGILTAFVGSIYRSLYEQAFWKGLVGEHVTITIVVALALAIDYRLTKSRRRSRDETLTLLQKKITHAIWVIFGIGVFISFYAVIKLGGGTNVLGLHIVLAGSVLLILGMFSEPWIRWAGGTTIISGIAAILLLEPSTTLRIFTACVFAIGAPTIQVFSPWATSAIRCAGLSLAWVALVAITAIAVVQVQSRLVVPDDNLPAFNLAELKDQAPSGRYRVLLPAGTRIPVELSVEVDVLGQPANATMDFQLAKPLEVVVEDGQPNGTFRVGGGPWLRARDALYRKQFLRETYISPEDGPILRRKLVLATDRLWGGLDHLD